MAHRDPDNEPVPSLLAGGAQWDLDREALRLCLLVRAAQNRAAAAARRAEGWRPIDEWLTETDDRPDLEPSSVDWRQYVASAESWRLKAEERRSQIERPE